MDLASRLNAILFIKTEPQNQTWLANKLEVAPTELAEAVPVLRQRLNAIGLTLIDNGQTLALGTSPEAEPLTHAIIEEERSGDLSRAALETLAVVLYLGPISRAKIDYWRGVNSGFTLRLLSIRGLVERAPDPNDSRSYLYRASAELLAHLGADSPSALPEYQKIKNEVEKIIAGNESLTLAN